ncbi:MAG: hypothetical protein HND57_02520 [Planctomycetes bacterium]|nr:hypothetical protein [Planctomycetota bacterium]
MSLDDIVAMHDTFLESPDIAYDMPSPNPEDPMQQAADLQHMLLMNPELLADPGMMPGYWPGPLAPM